MALGKYPSMPFLPKLKLFQFDKMIEVKDLDQIKNRYCMEIDYKTDKFEKLHIRADDSDTIKKIIRHLTSNKVKLADGTHSKMRRRSLF